MPRLTILRLPNDHTSGTRVGKPTPTAYMADNDLALGKVVEGVSNSKFWKDTAIFVIEDDAQNGSDHVDAHRTVALVISPYTKRARGSSLYSTRACADGTDSGQPMSHLTRPPGRYTPALQRSPTSGPTSMWFPTPTWTRKTWPARGARARRVRFHQRGRGRRSAAERGDLRSVRGRTRGCRRPCVGLRSAGAKG